MITVPPRTSGRAPPTGIGLRARQLSLATLATSLRTLAPARQLSPILLTSRLTRTIRNLFLTLRPHTSGRAPPCTATRLKFRARQLSLTLPHTFAPAVRSSPRPVARALASAEKTLFTWRRESARTKSARPLSLPFLPLLLLLLSLPHPAFAQANPTIGGGGACTGFTDSDTTTQGAQLAANDGLYTCSGSVWTPETLVVGSVLQSGAAPTCSSATAGMLYYTAGTVEFCNGSSFTSFAAGASVALSNITAATGTNTLSSGSNAQVWNWSLGGTGATAITFGEAAHATSGGQIVNITTLASSTAVPLTIQNGETATTNPISINMTAGALAIGGVNVLELPYADTSSIAVGENALQAQSVTGLANTAVGNYALYSSTDGADNSALGAGALEYTTYGAYNTAIGVSALRDNIGGTYNTALGAGALTTITTGNDSTAIGSNALYSATGSPNDALGLDAGEYISTGASNVAIGYGAMQGVSATPVTGSYNTAVGNSALQVIQGAASRNSALGFGALLGNTTGSYNTAIGEAALYFNTTASYNTAVGQGALLTDVTGNDNTAIGVEALFDTTSGPNDALGLNAGQYISSGTGNVALGYESMQGVAATPLTGSYNTAVGNAALYSLQGAAAGNTAVGETAGSTVTTGTNNVYIGYNAAAHAAADTNEIVIGEATTGNGSNTITLGNSSITNLYHYGTETLNGTTSGYVALSPGVSPANQTYTLPPAYPGTSGYVLSSTTAGAMSWVANGSAASIALSSITAATGANTILSGTHPQVWEWALTGQTAMTFGESAAATGASQIVNITTLASSTATPLTIQNGATATTNPISINMTAGALAIGGANVLELPYADTSSIAVGENALVAQSATGRDNTAVGTDAGEYNSSGYGNNAFGYTALQGVSATPLTGNSNIAIGDGALADAQGAMDDNIAIGASASAASALQNLASGNYNVAIGSGSALGAGNSALGSLTTGSNNTAVGSAALNLLAGASYDTAVGFAALASLTNGANSTAVGYYALQSATGAPNTALGYQAGINVTTGADNLAIGVNAMNGGSAAGVSGSYNLAIGDNSMILIAGAAQYNTAVGGQALASSTTGTDSTAVGYYALKPATGSPNTALGYYAGVNITTGANNTAIGTNAMNGGAGAGVSGSYNVAVGDTALSLIAGAGADNTAIGGKALAFSTTGTDSTAVGFQALNQATGSPNDALGYGAGQNITTGTENVAIGYESMYGVAATPLTGSNNTAVGYTALLSIQGAANSNTAIGNLALNALTTGTDSTAIGYNVLGNATGSPNYALGYQAGRYVTSGSDNIAIGYEALYGTSANPLTAANAGNIAIGDNALDSITGAAAGNVAIGYNVLTNSTINGTNPNTAIGMDAMEFATTSSNNTAIGNQAMMGTTAHPMTGAGAGNVAVGDNALFSISGAMSANTAVGYQAMNNATSGTSNVAVGDDALQTGDSSNNTAVGNQAMANASGGNNTALGYEVGLYISTGSNDIAIGYQAMKGVSANPLTTSPGGNIALGDNALTAITGAAAGNVAVGYNALTKSTVNSTAPNTAVGYEALEYATTGTNNTALGNLAMQGVSATPMTGTGYNVAIGDSALAQITGTTTENVAIGYEALQKDTGGSYNIAIGYQALYNDTNNANIGIGEQALLANTTGTNSTAVGYFGLASATGSPNDAFGYDAGEYISTGTDNVALGFQAMQGVSATQLTGGYNTAVGQNALYAIQGAAADNAALGEAALEYNSTGSFNTAIGQGALAGVAATPLTGNDNTALGEAALNIIQGAAQQNTAVGAIALEFNSTGDYNTAVGLAAMQGVAATPLTGSYNTALGEAALTVVRGVAAGNTAVGEGAGSTITTGTNNVYIGYSAAANAATDSNEIVIGEGTTGGGSNTATIGNSSITSVALGSATGVAVTIGASGASTTKLNIGPTTGASVPGTLVPGIVTTAVNTNSLAAVVAATTLVTPAANIFYRFTCTVFVTTQATTSATVPTCNAIYTDVNTNATITNNVGAPIAAAANPAVGVSATGTAIIYAKSGVAVQYSTTGYASSGATTMKYTLHVLLEQVQ
jgi:trimeric autotransporter adhesin